MRVERPIRVTLIGDMSLLIAFLAIVSLFPISKFTDQFGFSFIPISNFSDCIIRILRIVSLLAISYGFLKLKKWGYWLVIYYNLFFLIVSMIFLSMHITQSYIDTDFIAPLFALIITFPAKRYFI